MQIGLYPYISFIREIIALDPDVGILLIELPTFSMRITASPIAPRTLILKALDSILTSLHKLLPLSLRLPAIAGASRCRG